MRYRNWKTFNDQTMDFCQGITLHHLPGHTDGLIGMQINMLNTGTFFFISDHCHVIENVSYACFTRWCPTDFVTVAGWDPSGLVGSRPPIVVQEYTAS